jgi:hypothetical protein
VCSSLGAEKNECSNVGDSGSKKYKRGCGGAYGGVWRSLRLAGVWSQQSVLCWCVWQESGFSCLEDVSYLINVKELSEFYALV